CASPILAIRRLRDIGAGADGLEPIRVRQDPVGPMAARAPAHRPHLIGADHRTSEAKSRKPRNLRESYTYGTRCGGGTAFGLESVRCARFRKEAERESREWREQGERSGGIG